MGAEEHKQRAPKTIRFAVVTVSDSRTPETDTGGKLAREWIEAAGHSVAVSRIVKDDLAQLRATLQELLRDSQSETLLFTGGTGISSRDMSYEALSPLLEKRLDGFGELFRSLSYAEIGSAAMLSRAVGGVIQGKPVFLVPGSPKAVRLALEKILLPEIGHILAELKR